MVQRALRFTSVLCCLLVAASFGLFARDQVAGAAQAQQDQLVASGPTVSTGTGKPHQEAQPRRFIDGAAAALTAPFRTVVPSSSAWVNHGVPAVIALLIYGLGLGTLARFAKRKA